MATRSRYTSCASLASARRGASRNRSPTLWALATIKAAELATLTLMRPVVVGGERADLYHVVVNDRRLQTHGSAHRVPVVGRDVDTSPTGAGLLLWDHDVDRDARRRDPLTGLTAESPAKPCLLQRVFDERRVAQAPSIQAEVGILRRFPPVPASGFPYAGGLPEPPQPRPHRGVQPARRARQVAPDASQLVDHRRHSRLCSIHANKAAASAGLRPGRSRRSTTT